MTLQWHILIIAYLLLISMIEKNYLYIFHFISISISLIKHNNFYHKIFNSIKHKILINICVAFVARALFQEGIYKK